MKASNTERKKEDHLAPTKIEQDNTPETEKAEKYLSDKEVQERLDLYSKGSQEQFFKVQKIKKRYVEEMKGKEANRSQADLHYAQGVRAGLPQTHHENIRDTRELADQNFRDETVKEAKTEYRNHKNLSKLLNKKSKVNEKVEQSSNKEQQKPKAQKQKSLSKYFRQNMPSQQEVPKTIEKTKGKGMDKER